MTSRNSRTVFENIPIFDRVSDYVHHYAADRPEVDALILDGISITYRELNSLVDKCSRALIASGVKKGDRVATLSTPHPDFLVIFLSCTSIGAIWIGLNPKYTINELSYVVSDSEPKLIFSRTKIDDRNYSDDLLKLCEAAATIEDLIILDQDPLVQNSKPFDDFMEIGVEISTDNLLGRRREVSGDDPALIVYTSGSTGRPKGALLPHRGLTLCSRIQSRYWDCDPLRLVNFLPINHVGCVGDMSSYTLVAGGTVVFMESFDPEESLRLVSEHRITCLAGVPTTLQMCTALPNFDEFDLSTLQMIVWSGAAATVGLVTKLASICTRLSNSYGLTETVGAVTFVDSCDDIDRLSSTVGKPVPDYEFRIADSNNVACEPNVEGEIQVRGDFVMLGYWRRPDATKAAFSDDGWLKTGDLAVEQKDGNIRIIGRFSEMYKSGGYNIYPQEVERVLESHPKITMAAVIGVPDELYGEIGNAYVLSTHDTDISPVELQKYCRGLLANYKVPKSIFIETTLPMLPIGKIDKQALRKRSQSGLQQRRKGQ